jgi:GNAT superfamily N-acetyltransferase
MYCRLATLKDLSKINPFIAVAVEQMISDGNGQWSSTYPTNDHFTTDIENRVLWVVAVPAADSGINEDIAGVAAITTDQYEQYVECGWSLDDKAVVPHRVCVNSAYRGKGVGEMLYNQAEVYARSLGINRIRVDTYSGNIPMCSLINKRMGYSFCGTMQLTFATTGEKGVWNCYEKILENVSTY